MNESKLRSRLRLNNLLFIIPLVFLIYLMWSTETHSINFVEKEKIGLKVIKNIHSILINAIKIELNKKFPNISELQNDQEFFNNITNSESLLESDYINYQNDLLLTNNDFEIRNLNHLKIKNLNTSIEDKNWQKLISQCTELISHITNTSNLILDPDLDSYYLMNIATLVYPKIINHYFALILQNDFKSNLFNLKRNLLPEIQSSLVIALQEDARFYQTSPLLKKIFNDYQILNENNQSMIKQSDSFLELKTLDVNSFFNNQTSLLLSHSDFWLKSFQTLDQLLNQRYTTLTHKRSLNLFLALFAIIIASIGTYAFVQEINQTSLELKNKNWLDKKNNELQSELNVKKNELNQNYEKMVSSSKMAALGQMAASLAHEINNPNGIILMKATQIIKKSDAETIDKEIIKRNSEQIIQLSERITKIIQGLKFFSRSDETLQKEKTEFNKIINETLLLCENRYKNSPVELFSEINCNGILDCNPVQISQVIINLLNNAFDAVVEKDKPWVKLEVNQDLSLQKLIIKVTDSGLGIPPEVVTKLMTPFFTTKEVGKGTGLGLSISKGIIEAHGGTFAYNPESPHTQFVVTLPLSLTIENTTSKAA